MSEVAITGIGIVSPFGIGKNIFCSSIQKKKSVNPKPLSEFHGTQLENFGVGSVGELEKASKQFNRKHIKFMSTATLIGCLAGKEAADEACITERFAPHRIGIFSATGLTAANISESREMLEACMDKDGNFSDILFGEKGLPSLNPLNSFKILPNMPPCILSLILGVTGPNMIFNPWEDQAACAILEGYKAVKEGEADCVLVGAADTPSLPPTVAYLKQQNILGENSYPSSAGAYLVLESDEIAINHHRKIYGIIKNIEVICSAEKVYDPLSAIIGRTFAAAPALFLAGAAMGITNNRQMIGTRGTRFEFSLEINK
ncbi:MAG: beta-ketoacyl synthase N-terminal-like domain-containing protein [Pseudomonadota bacterium]